MNTTMAAPPSLSTLKIGLVLAESLSLLVFVPTHYADSSTLCASLPIHCSYGV